MYNQSQMVAHYRENLVAARELVGVYKQTQATLKQQQAQLAKVRDAAFFSLAQAYLPTLDEAALARAEMLTGFRGFSRRSPLAALEKALEVRRRRIAVTEADERYRRRQFLVGPHGELQTKLTEAQSMLQPWAQDCAKFEHLPGFEDLIESGYDTPRFALSFLSARYWRLWKQGDAVCEALGMDDFGDDVLPAYQEVVAKRQQWRDVVFTIQGNIDAVHALVQAHDRCVAEIPLMPQRILEQSQQGLAEHLQHADMALLEDWLGAPPDRVIQQALRRAAGVRAKLGFLQEAVDKGLSAFIADLEKRQFKFERKVRKYNRSKNWGGQFGPEHQDQKFGTKLAKYRAEQLKLQNQMDRLMGFEAYDGFDLDQDPELWWWHMTGKQPSRYLPSTRRYYKQVPRDELPSRKGWEKVDLSQAVSSAVAQQEMDVDYLS